MILSTCKGKRKPKLFPALLLFTLLTFICLIIGCNKVTDVNDVNVIRGLIIVK